MNVTHAIFHIGERVFPSDARAMTALLMDEIQPALMSTLMNYEAGTTKTQTKFPVVQFAYAKDGFSLLGFGEEGGAAVEDATPLIHQALSKKYRRIIRVESRTLALSAEARPYPLRYTVPKMVVQKKAQHQQWLRDPEKGKQHIEQLFLRSLKRQAEAVGMTLPADLSVEFLGAEGDFAAKQKGDAKLAMLGLRGAVFDVNARLGGIWSVGYMLSKGYGDFNATYQLSGMRNGVA